MTVHCIIKLDLAQIKRDKKNCTYSRGRLIYAHCQCNEISNAPSCKFRHFSLCKCKTLHRIGSALLSNFPHTRPKYISVFIAREKRYSQLQYPFSVGNKTIINLRGFWQTSMAKIRQSCLLARSTSRRCVQCCSCTRGSPVHLTNDLHIIHIDGLITNPDLKELTISRRMRVVRRELRSGNKVEHRFTISVHPSL